MHNTLLFVGTFQDKQFLPKLKPLVGTARVVLYFEPVTTWTEVKMLCAAKKATAVLTTSPSLLNRLVQLEGKKSPSISNYAGSYFKRDGIEIVFLNPLEQLYTVPYGEFIAKRFISKLTSPESWVKTPTFSFSILKPDNIESAYSTLEEADFISCDIETFKNNLAIRCIGYTALSFDSEGNPVTNSYVLPIDSLWALSWMRKINSLPNRKILQNGKYDCLYLSRYDAVPINYLYDTINLMHCTYSELPKDLGFVQAMTVREASYWKDLSETKDLYEYYKYNALDTWATALGAIELLRNLPEYGVTNYLQEFPLVFPAHMCELIGIHQNQKVREEQYKKIEKEIEAQNTSLNRMLGTKNFNSNSHVQVKKLLTVLGCADIAKESSDEKHIKKAQFRHPLNAVILEKILDIRGLRKLASTYLTDKSFKGVVLYSENPHGTDTGRQTSTESAFWCGLQIQNIPRGKEVKCTLVPAPGFMLAEADLEQAESRDTAHIAGDEQLIKAVSGTKDFHSLNASAFFGRPYDTIYDDTKKKTLDKVLRDLAKRVNHGANYLMGPDVLVDTMGLKNIYAAASALKLPGYWTPRQIATYLLEQFHKTYPFLSSTFYPAVVNEVILTKKLTSKATHEAKYQATKAGWVRYCFGQPNKNKRHKNAYVAHAPQSLNAMTLNKAFMQVFYDIALNPLYRDNFRLHAQIHDSILFSFRIGHEYLADMVKERMEIPVTVLGYDGKTRTFTVPAAVKAGKDGKGALSWAETE